MKYIQVSALIAFLFSLVSVSSNSHSMGKQIFIGTPSEPQCRNCHDNLTQFPMLGVKNTDRHHRLIGTVIPSINRSKAPDAIGAQNSGTAYNCLSCHIFSPASGMPGDFGITQSFRNCLQCHPVNRVTGRPMRGNNVHHETLTFQQRRCSVCHNSGGMGGRR